MLLSPHLSDNLTKYPTVNNQAREAHLIDRRRAVQLVITASLFPLVGGARAEQKDPMRAADWFSA
jgi:hypothetical protein